jgi:hypothetical protein
VDEELQASAGSITNSGSSSCSVTNLVGYRSANLPALSLSGNRGPSVVWLRLVNYRTPELLRILTPLWPLAIARLADGEKLVELRG